MKVPFRWQVSEYDCVPTTVLNALTFLYSREEIPPVVVQRIFLYCLDSMSNKIDFAHGTSGFAVQLLAEWLNNYRYKNFTPIVRFISGEDVHISRRNHIVTEINRGGAALISVTYTTQYRHYILAIKADKEFIYCFDPYPRSTKINKIGCYEFLPEAQIQEPNLRISREWLERKSPKERFTFGPFDDREVLLIRRGEK